MVSSSILDVYMNIVVQVDKPEYNSNFFGVEAMHNAYQESVKIIHWPHFIYFECIKY